MSKAKLQGLTKDDLPDLHMLRVDLAAWQSVLTNPDSSNIDKSRVLAEIKRAKQTYSFLKKGKKLYNALSKTTTAAEEIAPVEAAPVEAAPVEAVGDTSEVVEGLAETGEVLEDVLPLLLL
tara:strand:+ start:139 stop:501 length:363 start_codon:yes stop_codon:yes gene_type:complete